MKRKPTQRERLLEIVAVNVRALAARRSLRAHRQLEHTMELTGYLNNLGQQTSESLAEAIIALSTVVPRDKLIDVAHGAVFYRHSQGPGRSSNAAAKLADDAIRACGIDIDKRNADSEREADEVQARWVAKRNREKLRNAQALARVAAKTLREAQRAVAS